MQEETKEQIKEIVLMRIEELTARDIAKFRREGYHTLMANGIFKAWR